MGHETEAAGLLRSGRLFLRRVGLRRAGEAEVHAFAGVKPGTSGREPGALAVYFGDEPYFHLDMEGRWQRIFEGGVHYRKALDNSADALERRREGSGLVIRRRALRFAEIADLDERARQMAIALLAAGEDELVAPPDGSPALGGGELRALLERVARWDADSWFRHREAYVAAYAPLPLLPPDAPLAVAFQGTPGPRGRAFGSGVGQEFADRTPEEFAAHVGQVLELYGRRIEQAKGAFLAGADVLRLPAEQVLAYLEAIRTADERGVLGRVWVFLDEFGPPRPDRAELTRYRSLGLERVVLGVESGAPEVRAMYGARWTEADLRAMVAAIREAGIGMSLLVLAGAGGSALSDRHGHMTAALVATLGLGAGDSVFVLDAAEVGDATLGGAVEPLGPGEGETHRDALVTALRAAKGTGVKVVPYSLEKQ